MFPLGSNGLNCFLCRIFMILKYFVCVFGCSLQLICALTVQFVSLLLIKTFESFFPFLVLHIVNRTKTWLLHRNYIFICTSSLIKMKANIIFELNAHCNILHQWKVHNPIKPLNKYKTCFNFLYSILNKFGRQSETPRQHFGKVCHDNNFDGTLQQKLLNTSKMAWTIFLHWVKKPI